MTNTVLSKITAHRTNPTPASEARLLAELQPFIRACARRWCGHELSMADLEQEAALALLLVIRSGPHGGLIGVRRAVGHALRGAVRAARLVRGVRPSRVQQLETEVD